MLRQKRRQTSTPPTTQRILLPKRFSIFAFADGSFGAVFISLFAIFMLIAETRGCPEQVRAMCECMDHVDGVLLNCTVPPTTSAGHESAIRLLNILRASQAQLGLLKVLSIRRARIPVLPRGAFDGLYIRRLELVDCELEAVEKGAFSGLETILQELLLANNRLKEVPSGALQGLQGLTRLTLSKNLIEELRGGNESLPRLNKLIDLDLSHNRISSIHKTFFDGVKHSVQMVNLGHNQIRELPASALRGFRMLLALHLLDNELERLEQLSFLNLPVLSLMNLASNKIRSIHRQAFLNVPNLRYLYLSANQITEVLPHQFAQFEQLELLDLSANRLETLDNDSFAELPSLRQLYLGENQIRSIGPYAFQNCSVQVLALEANQLSELDRTAVQGAHQLQQLSLKRNRLRSVDANAFQHNPSLVMVDLSHNQLLDLAPATFLNQLGLLLVDVSSNQIVRTPFAAFNRRISTVLLQENPLVCAERIHMLQQGVGIHVPDSPDLICKRQDALVQSQQSPAPELLLNSTTLTTTAVNFAPKLVLNNNFPNPNNGSHQLPHASNEFDVTDDATNLHDEETDAPAFVLQEPADLTPMADLHFATTSARTSFDLSNSIQKIATAQTRLPNIRPLAKPTETSGLTTAKLFSERRQELTEIPANNSFFQVPNHPLSSVTHNKKPSYSAPIRTLPEPRNSLSLTPRVSSSSTTPSLPSSWEQLHSSASISTPQPPVTSTIDERDAIDRDPILGKPGYIYPHPVPFLQQGPRLHTSQRLEDADVATLPPNIVLARPRQDVASSTEAMSPFADGTSMENGGHAATNETSATGLDHLLLQKVEEPFGFNPLAPPSTSHRSTANHPPHQQNSSVASFERLDQHLGSAGDANRAAAFDTPRLLLPNSVIFACLGLVALVSSGVFVGLCVAKQRQLRYIQSINTRGDFYTPSSSGIGTYLTTTGAARRCSVGGPMGMVVSPGGNSGSGYGSAIYASCPLDAGTLSRSGAFNIDRNPPRPPRVQRTGPVQDDAYSAAGWVYTPGSYNNHRLGAQRNADQVEI